MAFLCPMSDLATAQTILSGKLVITLSPFQCGQTVLAKVTGLPQLSHLGFPLLVAAKREALCCSVLTSWQALINSLMSLVVVRRGPIMVLQSLLAFS